MSKRFPIGDLAETRKRNFKELVYLLCVLLGFSILSSIGKSSFAQNHAQNVRVGKREAFRLKDAILFFFLVLTSTICT